MKSAPKQWGKQETDFLMSLRMSMEEEFSSAKSHKSLWRKICEQLNSRGFTATMEQCDNKYKSLKRDYKSTVDKNAQSGSDAKRCPYFEDFNKLYGLKASTKPTATASSLDSVVVEEQRDRSKTSKAIVKKAPSCTTTVEFLQQYEERQANQRQKFHTERMEMMAQLIDAIKKS